jgi:hypothetical protein
MTQEIEIAGFQIPQADWEATPASVKALVTLLLSLLQQTQEQLAQ